MAFDMKPTDSQVILENKRLFHMLEFENQIFLDILHKDGLVITAKGLSIDIILLNLFRVYSDPGNLLLVLNCAEYEEKYLIEKMKDDNVRSYNSYTTEKELIYLAGGILFVTTRILVVDMLKNRIPIDKITGIIVLRAHNVLESCQEAFVLRLFRQKNKPQIIELRIPTSPVMMKIQTCILDLMNLTVKELKSINKTLEIQEITVENCIMKNFHKMLQYQLEHVWHQLSAKTKQLVAELKTLQHLIISMLHSDPVTFYSMLAECRTMEYAQTANWVLLPPAELLFEHAKELIYNKNKELSPQGCPKWTVLSEILKVEIPADIKETDSKDNKVLILCQDKKSSYQLKEFLVHGQHYYLFLSTLTNGIKFTSIDKKFKSCEHLQHKFSTKAKPVKKNKKKVEKKLDDEEKPSENEDRKEDDVEEELKNQYLLSLTQSHSTTDEGQKLEDCFFETFEEMENMDITQLTAPRDLTILIQTFKSDNYLSLQKILEDLCPAYVIAYHSNITIMRQIELYEARRVKDRPLKIYYLVHSGTVEEQNYLTALRREKEAFEFLIETRSKMVISEDQDGKVADDANPENTTESINLNTRQGGKPVETHTKQFVIVDMREFRSELPALLHKKGIDIEPVQITVGDYILTPDICVERKSLSDLVGSLNSGRLYQQCTQMSRYYSKPMLLIEFDQNRPFSWQNNYMVSSDGNSFDIQQKLLLLTMHFPKLKIIWSASPYASAQLFEELKHNREQPNMEYATAIGSEEDLDILQRKYNTSIYDFIQKLPGITSKNIDTFLRKVKNLDKALNMTEEELKEVLGNSVDAKSLHSILHVACMPKENIEMNVKQKLQKNNPKH